MGHAKPTSWAFGPARLPLRLTPTRSLLALSCLAALLFLSQVSTVTTTAWSSAASSLLPVDVFPVLGLGSAIGIGAPAEGGDPFDDIPAPGRAPPFVLEANATHTEQKEKTVNAKERTVMKKTAAVALALAPLSRLTAPAYRPTCALTPAHLSRYAALTQDQAPTAIFLALNLLDAQWPLASLLHALPVLLPYLGPQHLFVSVLENGSSDKTPGMLAVLANFLSAHGIAYHIEVRGEGAKSEKSGGRRIIELAKLRNEVMQPLYDGSAALAAGVDAFGRVLFLNDIVFCAADVLEVLYEHKTQGADMACSLDWGSHIVYDRWVLRGMSGSPSYAQPDLLAYFAEPPPARNPVPQPFPSADREAGERLRALEPFQVFSCWNGAVVMPAAAFVANSSQSQMEGDTRGTGRGPVRFRTAKSDPDAPVAGDGMAVTEKASECFLVPVDLWKRGWGKIMVVPRASVAYTGYDYDEVRQDGGRAPELDAPHPAHLHYIALPAPLPTPHTAAQAKATETEQEKTRIAWASEPPREVVYHDYAWWHAAERWGAWDEAARDMHSGVRGRFYLILGGIGLVRPVRRLRRVGAAVGATDAIKPFPVQPYKTSVNATEYGPWCLHIPVVFPNFTLSNATYIFGGGFDTAGSSVYDGSVIVQKSIDIGSPVVYVSFNHRVNGFGFLASQEVTNAGVANLGLQDQRQALRWVQKYISSFGGDPAKVTLFGLSSGAISTALHMLLNDGDNEGLFRAAWSMSGGPLPVGSYTHGQKWYDSAVAATNCTDAGDTLGCLRAAPVDVLHAYFLTTPSKGSYQALQSAWLPRVDGTFLKDVPLNLVAQGSVAKIPFISGARFLIFPPYDRSLAQVLTGDADDEGTLFNLYQSNLTTDADFTAYLQNNYFPAATPADVDRIVRLHPADPAAGSPFGTGANNSIYPQYKRLAVFQGDFTFQGPRRSFLQHRAALQNAWSYVDKRDKTASTLGSFHTLDATDSMYGPSNATGTELQDYIISFAYNLNPNGRTVPKWARYTAEAPTMMALLDGVPTIGAVEDTYRAEAIEGVTKIGLIYPL
ncbi:glycosyltransferase family 69 protein [Athelia psychrophila]|uniref:Glycosyltransferase family 69 protein n=1 Tax=Athelia psychrophila TaxID=1759441 RepID=A0A166AN01_9AGAM|nr:glycosyltransferase family 69 protein [Fibularhizoctonia sp. CBS 109695]